MSAWICVCIACSAHLDVTARRFLPEANGVLLCYWNARVIDKAGRFESSPFVCVCGDVFDVLCFRTQCQTQFRVLCPSKSRRPHARATQTARIYYEQEWLHFRVQADVLVFSPLVGDYVMCKVNKVGHDHIAGLVMGVFNTTVVADGDGGLLDHYQYNPEFEMWSSVTQNNREDVIEVGTYVRLKLIGYVACIGCCACALDCFLAGGTSA